MAFLSRAAVAVVVTLLLLTLAAQAQTLSLEGKVKQPQHWTIEDLKKLPAEHVDVSYQTDRGPVNATFTGVSLWSSTRNVYGCRSWYLERERIP